MATRKSSGKLHASQFVPSWGPKQTALVNMLFMEVLTGLGVHDLASYFRGWSLAAVIACVVLFASLGGYNYGIGGFIGGGAVGVAAPVVLLWLTILLAGITLFLAVYLLACLAVWTLLRWIGSALFSW